MGLHRDPTAYSSSPIECQVRRLVWYQICFLDLRTCDAVGPRPQIRLDDYDTRFPLNVDDEDLDRAERGERGVDVSKDSNRFTDMTISLMRFEGYEMHRFLWSERPKLERKRTGDKSGVTITSILSRVQSFQAAMEKKYLPMLSKTEPLHVLASELHGIVSNRLYVAILQKYIAGARNKMPERLRQLTMSAATMILEHGMSIEQHPILSSWAWIVGALHQHHSALLLVNEICVSNPEPAMEQRIWRCLDYSFNLPPGLPNIEKTRIVLEDLVGKSKRYTEIKRIRAPTNMRDAGPAPEPRTQAQQEDKHRQNSVPAPTANAGPFPHNIGGRSTPQQLVPSPRQSALQHASTMGPRRAQFPGAIPTVDWGTIDLPASLPISQQQTYSDFHLTTPAQRYASVAEHTAGSNASSPNSAVYGMTPGSTGSNSMDAINDIDWVSFLSCCLCSTLTKTRMMLRECLVVQRRAREICLFRRLLFRSSLVQICDGLSKVICSNVDARMMKRDDVGSTCFYLC